MKHTVHVADRFQFDIDLDRNDPHESWVLSHFDAHGGLEPEVMNIMIRAIRHGDFVIDVGAAIGFFTMLMAGLVGPTGMVAAFEPGRNIVEAFKKHIAANQICNGNVQLVEQPLWCRDEPITFHLCADTRGSNAVYDPGLYFENVKSQAKKENYQVDAVTLDTVVGDRFVRLIKIDTEGAEFHILQGARKLLGGVNRPQYIITEFNPCGLKFLGVSLREMREYMHGFGYDTFLLPKDIDLPVLAPPRTEVLALDDIVTCNIMFSTVAAVGAICPEVRYA